MPIYVQLGCQLPSQSKVMCNIHKLAVRQPKVRRADTVRNRTPMRGLAALNASPINEIGNCPQSDTSVAFRAASQPIVMFDVETYLKYNDLGGTRKFEKK
jgi:hypothetical protein